MNGKLPEYFPQESSSGSDLRVVIERKKINAFTVNQKIVAQ